MATPDENEMKSKDSSQSIGATLGLVPSLCYYGVTMLFGYLYYFVVLLTGYRDTPHKFLGTKIAYLKKKQKKYSVEL